MATKWSFVVAFVLERMSASGQEGTSSMSSLYVGSDIENGHKTIWLAGSAPDPKQALKAHLRHFPQAVSLPAPVCDRNARDPEVTASEALEPLRSDKGDVMPMLTIQTGKVHDAAHRARIRGIVSRMHRDPHYRLLVAVRREYRFPVQTWQRLYLSRDSLLLTGSRRPQRPRKIRLSHE